jgi:hypothetical protein
MDLVPIEFIAPREIAHDSVCDTSQEIQGRLLSNFPAPNVIRTAIWVR